MVTNMLKIKGNEANESLLKTPSKSVTSLPMFIRSSMKVNWKRVDTQIQSHWNFAFYPYI